MMEHDKLTEIFGENQWKLRVRFHIDDDSPLTNRELLSLASVLDYIVRSVTKRAILELQQHLQLSRRQATILREALDRLPAPSLETGELIDFSRGDSWTINIGIPAAAIMSILYGLMRVTVLKDIETSWHESQLSKKFRQILQTNIIEVMGRTAQAMQKHMQQVGRLGSRMVHSHSEVNFEPQKQEIRLDIEVRRSQIVAGTDRDLDIE